MARVEELLTRLDRVRQTGPQEWTACCPAHKDKHPSLAIAETDDGRVLIHCFAGCATDSILSALGSSFEALFPQPLGHRFKPKRHPFSPAAVLRCIQREAMIVAIVASDLRTGKELSDDDRKRLWVAEQRIRTALEYA